MQMRSQLGAELQGRILELTVDTFGCRIVQKAFEASLPCLRGCSGIEPPLACFSAKLHAQP